jgi:dipeptidyl aminopeptidase/acylaminoacyl peptidase
MYSTPLRHLLAILLVAVVALPAVAAAPAPPPVEAFFQNIELGKAVISPDGRFVAARAAFKGVRAGLVLIDLNTMTSSVLARYANGDVDVIQWTSARRIAFTVVNIDAAAQKSTSGLYAVDIDGKELRGLTPSIVNQRSFSEAESFQGPSITPQEFVGEQLESSESMFVIVNYDGLLVPGKLNTRSNKMLNMSVPRNSHAWLLDDAEHVRIALTRDGDQEQMFFLQPNGTWRKLSRFQRYGADALIPRMYLDNTLYVQSRNGGDRVGLYRYNTENNAIDGPAVINSPDFDVEGSPVVEGSKLLGFRTYTDGEDTVWFDPGMKALQAEVDAILPQTINRIERGKRSTSPFILVRAYSSIHPGDTLVYNRDTKTMTKLGTALPGIQTAQMAPPTEMLRYPTRDGRSMPAYVTLPNAEAKKQLPTVILAGAYPWKRNGLWEFDPVVQFLASRGYAVVQPEARGSRGFGDAHFKAGFKQWGLAMQDDLADSAKWAIAQGIADPKRICIAGTVYGGYAAMMGVIKDPELFKCGVSWAGIVDIGMMFKHRWVEFPTSAYGDEMKVLVGDPRADAAQFAATSPLQQAGRIKRPVLLAYGAKDVEVPGEHGRKLYDAIKPHNPDAEFIMFDEQGQPPSLEANRAQLWTRVAQFLERHIGPGK